MRAAKPPAPSRRVISVGGLRQGPAPFKVADLDRDGRLDVITTSGEVMTYTTAQGLRGLGGPSEIEAVVDLSGDGFPDLAGLGGFFAAEAERVAFVQRADGHGGFLDPEALSWQDALSLVAGDWNGDGARDLVLASYYKSGVVFEPFLLIFQNGGAGSFDVWPYELEQSPLSIVAEDFDDDGNTDLAVLLPPGFRPAVAFIRSRNGALDRPLRYPVGRGAYKLVAVDLDANGGMDLVALERGGSLSLLMGDPKGGFQDAASYPLTVEPDHFVVGDFDGDGAVDMAVGGGTGLSVLIGMGVGSFRPEARLQLEGSLMRLTAGDLNGDGRKELIAALDDTGEAASRSGLLILSSAGGAAFNRVFLPSPRTCRPGWVEVADMDGDERLDLVATHFECAWTPAGEPAEGNITVFFNSLSALASQDANRNGIPDECEDPPRPRFHRGDPNGDGQSNIADAVATLEFLFLGRAAPACREAADIDNDGAIDIADPVSLLQFLFQGGPGPAKPGPPTAACGPDPDPPGGPGDLGCEAYDACAPPEGA